MSAHNATMSERILPETKSAAESARIIKVVSMSVLDFFCAQR